MTVSEKHRAKHAALTTAKHVKTASGIRKRKARKTRWGDINRKYAFTGATLEGHVSSAETTE